MAAPQGTGEFAKLVCEHQGMVFSIAYHLVHDRSLAEEVAQDVFLQLYRVMQTLKSEQHVIFWLRKVTVHRAIDCCRRRVSRSEVPLVDVPEPASLPAPGDPMLSRRLRQVVASLPEKIRAVVVLRYQEDMGPEEIANTLGMPVATVKSYLQRGLAMLREKLARTLGEVKA
jgi:RNA polymerase sigma-70 factor (ECF subfamily)